MSKLGRNPFQGPRVKTAAAPVVPAPELPADLAKASEALGKFVFVDVPANAFVLGLKVFLLARDTFFERRR